MREQQLNNPEYGKLLQQTLTLQREASKEFYYSLRRAKDAAASNQFDLAVHWCRYGAMIAGLSNPGFFYSHEMEELLADIGRKTLPPVRKRSDVTQYPERFLHIMTAAYEIGGHTRAVSRWIDICAQQTPSETHSILISRQGESVPEWLVSSAQRTGGEVFELPSELSGLDAAAQIRSSSLEFDAVILHIHPYDPLANLAFYDQPRPVLFYNHADHMFSLGTSVAKVVADIRPVGHDLSMRFRSPRGKKVLLPLPLSDDGQRALSVKAEARQRLGLPGDALVVLTVGGGYFKSSSVLGYSFPAMVQAICAADPRVRLVALGMSETEPYPELKRATEGRFMPVGFINDRDTVELYYRTADVYLDSFPCTSLTSVIEAARHGLPVQRLCNPYQPLMSCDDPGLDSVARRARSQDEFVADVLEWLRWPDEKRVEFGGRFQAAVLRDHCGEVWKKNWLQPAINALALDRDASLGSKPERSHSEKEFSFIGLGKASWVAVNWSASMFVAGAIVGLGFVPRRIRLSGILHSIKPLIFDTGGDGTLRKRIELFRRLLPAIDLRRALRAPFKRLFA